MLEYPTDPASIFTIDCDVWPTIRPILTPDVRVDHPKLMLTGLQTSGPLDAGALARSIHDLHACKVAVVRRYQHREGPDHWADHREILSRLRDC